MSVINLLPITSCLNVWLLTRALRKKLGTLELTELKRAIKPVVAASIVAGALAALIYLTWDNWFGHATLAVRLGAVFVPASIASVMYWAVLWGDKLPAATEVTGLIVKKLRRSRE